LNIGRSVNPEQPALASGHIKRWATMMPLDVAQVPSFPQSLPGLLWCVSITLLDSAFAALVSKQIRRWCPEKPRGWPSVPLCVMWHAHRSLPHPPRPTPCLFP
jgi:hypothetical protein